MSHRHARLESIAQGTQGVWRAFSGAPDGCAGVVIDVLGRFVWVRIFDPALSPRLAEIRAAAEQVFPEAWVYCSARSEHEASGGSGAAGVTPASVSKGFVWSLPAGEVQPALALEPDGRKRKTGLTGAEGADGVNKANLKYEIRPLPLDDFGIYVDAGAARQWVLQNSEHAQVINLFAYTCGFGVAAKHGGAHKVTNVDMSRDYLSWGKVNAGLNGVDFAVVPEDCLKYLRRLNARVLQGAVEPPTLVVLDPPAFLQGRGAARLNRNVLPQMLRESFAVLPPGGRLLISCNDRYWNADGSARFLSLLSETAKESGCSVRFEKIPQSADVVGQTAGVSDSHHLPAQFWSVRLSK